VQSRPAPDAAERNADRVLADAMVRVQRLQIANQLAPGLGPASPPPITLVPFMSKTAA
jgi:hypothetical protein